jgi:hypothetical protein
VEIMGGRVSHGSRLGQFHCDRGDATFFSIRPVSIQRWHSEVGLNLKIGIHDDEYLVHTGKQSNF